MLAAGFPRKLTRRQTRTRGVDGRDADVVVEKRRTTRRLIPDVDAHAPGNAGRLLNRWVAYRDVAADSRVGRRRKHHDPIGVAVRGVLLDEVVVPIEDADAEIIVWSCEAVSRRLVPPERVVATDDSYAAAGQACDRTPIPDGDIRSKRDSRRRRRDADAGHAVRCGRHPFDLALQGAVEEDPVAAKSLNDAGSANLDVGLRAAVDARLCRGRCRTATRCIRVGRSRDREAVQPQLDVAAGELNARRAGDRTRHVTDESTVFPDRSRR